MPCGPSPGPGAASSLSRDDRGHSDLSSEVPSSGNFPLPPGWPGPLPRAPTEPECPSLSPSDSACASPITAPTALGCCCLSTAVYASGVGAPLDRARDIVSHCCVPSIAQGKVWSRVPPTYSLAVWPWARPLTSVPQCLICERGKKVAQATPQLPAELGRVWARLTLTFPRDGVTQGSGTAAVTTRAPGCRALQFCSEGRATSVQQLSLR